MAMQQRVNGTIQSQGYEFAALKKAFCVGAAARALLTWSWCTW